MKNNLNIFFRRIQLVPAIVIFAYFSHGAIHLWGALKEPDPRNLLGANEYVQLLLIASLMLGLASMNWIWKIFKSLT